MRQNAAASPAGSTQLGAGIGRRIWRAVVGGRAVRGADGRGASPRRSPRIATVAMALAIAAAAIAAGQAAAATPPSAEAFAREVDKTEADLGATINPNGSETTYQLEYVSAALYAPLAANPYGAGAVLPATPKSVGAGTSPVTVSQHVDGLAPGTEYHYRATAVSAEGTTASVDRTIVTPASVELDTSCPNQAFRTGFAASLPECRAYEMVSPVDKNGDDIKANNLPTNGELARLVQASVNGEKITYTVAAQPFGDEPSARYANQYVATRGPEGWSSHGVNAPLGTDFDGSLGTPHAVFLFQAFSPELSRAWLIDDNKPPLTADATGETYNWYWRDNGNDSYHFMAPYTYQEFEPRVEGYSADLSQVFYKNEAGSGRVYDAAGGEVRVVSVLPDGTEAAGDLGSGGSVAIGAGRVRTLPHAVSTDGSRVYWATAGITGALYLRKNPSQPASAVNGSGECTEPAKACTVPVSGTVSPSKPGIYWAATPSGSKALFSVLPSPGAPEGDLYTYDAATQSSSLVAGEVRGVLGASDDLAYVYFVSKAALAAGASAGGRNLYLDHEGTITFIATLAANDVGEVGETNVDGEAVPGEYSVVSTESRRHSSRVTPDGLHLAFMSRGSLTGYDNTDAGSGERDIEAYVYDAAAKRLVCASCRPSGARPLGRPLFRAYNHSFINNNTPARLWAAAWFPTPEYSTDLLHPLSEDGTLFFNSYDALLPQDTNGQEDVYEWRPQGVGGCDRERGCLSLISSGESSSQSEFLDASPDGHDVFIETQSSLLPQDPGLVDIYDARRDGGYPQPLRTAACEGEGCQSPPAAPNDPTPSSSAYSGPGNVAEAPARKKHAKKHAKKHRKAHGKAAKKHRGRATHRANHNRRAAR